MSNNNVIPFPRRRRQTMDSFYEEIWLAMIIQSAYGIEYMNRWLREKRRREGEEQCRREAGKTVESTLPTGAPKEDSKS